MKCISKAKQKNASKKDEGGGGKQDEDEQGSWEDLQESAMQCLLIGHRTYRTSPLSPFTRGTSVLVSERQLPFVPLFAFQKVDLMRIVFGL